MKKGSSWKSLTVFTESFNFHVWQIVNKSLFKEKNVWDLWKFWLVYGQRYRLDELKYATIVQGNNSKKIIEKINFRSLRIMSYLLKSSVSVFLEPLK